MARLLLLPGMIITFLFLFFLAAQSRQTNLNNAADVMGQTDSDDRTTSELPESIEPDEEPHDQPQNPAQSHPYSANEPSIFDTLHNLFTSLRDVFTHIARLDQQVNETIYGSFPSEGSFLLGIFSSARCLLTLFGFFTLASLASIWRKLNG